MSEVIANLARALTALSDIFKSFKLKHFVFFLFLIFLLFIIAVITWDLLTGYVYFSKLEKKVYLMKTLSDLSSDGIENTELYPIYQDLIGELKQYKLIPPLISSITSANKQTSKYFLIRFVKFISGSFVGFVFCFYFILKKDKGDTASYIIATIIFGVLFGIIGVIIPKIFFYWINIIGFPLVQMIGLYIMGKFIKTK